MQYTGDVRAMDVFTEGHLIGESDGRGGLFVDTDEGFIPLLFHDWVIKTKRHELRVVRASLFAIMYEAIEE